MVGFRPQVGGDLVLVFMFCWLVYLFWFDMFLLVPGWRGLFCPQSCSLFHLFCFVRCLAVCTGVEENFAVLWCLLGI